MRKDVSSQKTREGTQARRRTSRTLVTPTPGNTSQATNPLTPGSSMPGSIFSDMLIGHVTLEPSQNVSFDLHEARKMLESADRGLQNIGGHSQPFLRDPVPSADFRLNQLRSQFFSAEKQVPKVQASPFQAAPPAPSMEVPVAQPPKRRRPPRSTTPAVPEKAGSVSTEADSMLSLRDRKKKVQSAAILRSEEAKAKARYLHQKAAELKKKIDASGFVQVAKRGLTFELTVKHYPVGPFVLCSSGGETRPIRPRVRPLMPWLNERVLEDTEEGIWVAVARVAKTPHRRH